MEWLHQLLGEQNHVTALQMCARAFVVFFLTLLLIRIGGRRAFGKRSAFDNIVVIVLGSVVARGIVGANSLTSVTAAAAVLVIVHRCVAWLIIQNKSVEKMIKGDHLLLFENGNIIKPNLIKASMTIDDLYESLRQELHTESLDAVQKAFMENSGRISFILKKQS